MGEISNHSKYAQLSVISMRGCEEITAKIDWYLRKFREGYENEETYITHIRCPRFGSGEANGTRTRCLYHLRYV